MNRIYLQLFSALLLWESATNATRAADWFVATNGTVHGQGTKASPWDITSALSGGQSVAPGDTLWLRGGTYKYREEVGSMGFPVKLAGREGTPIHVRALPGERVTLDGGLNMQAPATHLWIWDLEILVSEPRPDKPVPPDPSYRNVNRPWGGLNVQSGTGCKFINLCLHDNSQGMSWWAGSTESEVHGCIFYDNGWTGTDRGHGHAIYTQNDAGTKAITDCLFTGGFGYSLHAYGSSRACVNNYLAEGNIAWRAGTFLIGGGRPSHGLRVLTNYLYDVTMQIGYSAPTNEDCIVRGNLVVNGALTINRFGQVVNEGNQVLAKTATRPVDNQVILRRNKYDPNRAYLLVFNWKKLPEVQVDLSSFLNAGDRFRLLKPRDFFGPPACTGTFKQQRVKLPMLDEFTAYVLVRSAVR